ncbi:hypothetical protein B0H14DRAFT_2624607 [Mycena olivaceomarginata]|nr:hypothetical protein B0H14DRAFT_2624607 [Mycena olivaceomarginata]
MNYFVVTRASKRPYYAHGRKVYAVIFVRHGSTRTLRPSMEGQTGRVAYVPGETHLLNAGAFDVETSEVEPEPEPETDSPNRYGYIDSEALLRLQTTVARDRSRTTGTGEDKTSNALQTNGSDIRISFRLSGWKSNKPATTQALLLIGGQNVKILSECGNMSRVGGEMEWCADAVKLNFRLHRQVKCGSPPFYWHPSPHILTLRQNLDILSVGPKS